MKLFQKPIQRNIKKIICHLYFCYQLEKSYKGFGNFMATFKKMALVSPYITH